MSERPISAADKTAISEDRILIFDLWFLDFLDAHGNAAPSRLCSIESGLNWGGNFWNGRRSGMMGRGEITESTDGAAENLKLTLSRIDSALMFSITGTQYQGRSAEVYEGRLDVDLLTIVPNPELVFSGKMESDLISDDGTSATLELTISSPLSVQSRARALRYTHSDQQLLYPDDTDDAYEFLPELRTTQLKWGGA